MLIIAENEITRGDTVDISKFHTHPTYSAARKGLVEDSAVDVSIAPSGAGFITSINDGMRVSGGDNGYDRMMYIHGNVDRVEGQLGINVKWSDHVVDPAGVWTYTLDLDSADKEANSLFVANEHDEVHASHHSRIQEELSKVKGSLYDLEPSQEISDLKHERVKIVRQAVEVVREQGRSAAQAVLQQKDAVDKQIAELEIKEGFTAMEDRIADLETQLRSLQEDNRKNSNKKLRTESYQKLETARRAWTLSAANKGVEAAINNGLYDLLVAAYKEVGVSVQYQPFAN